jgi:phosphatidylserine decarboxylase
LRLIPVASDGWRFIIPFAAIGGGLLFLSDWLATAGGTLLLLAAVFSVFFFRDFDRNTTVDDAVVYSPGDGKVMDVAQVHDANEGSYRLIRIFLSVFDGHVQRAPVAGRVEKVVYTKGTFLDARHANAHLDNERNALTIHSRQGKVVVTQIAGLIARRIVCWSKQGDVLGQGERFGLIRYGSQVDVALPLTSKISVSVGDRVVGGETVIARWN